jgi:DNA-binding CsgD family transcriptional regulator
LCNTMPYAWIFCADACKLGTDAVTLATYWMYFVSAIENIIREIPLGSALKKCKSGGPCVDNLEQALFRAAEELGFEYARYTCWLQDVAGEGDFSHSFSFNFSNFPVLWEQIYEKQQLYLYDPLVRILSASHKQLVVYGTWQDAWDVAEGIAQETDDKIYASQIQNLSNTAAQHGVNSGIYMMLNIGLRRLVISLGSSRAAPLIAEQVKGDLFQSVFSVVSLLCHTLDLTNNCQRCIKTLRVEGGKVVKLTPKQAKVLETFLDNPGATNGDVAKIHFVSPEAIAFHLKAIRQKFRKPHASGHALSHIAKAHGLI